MSIFGIKKKHVDTLELKQEIFNMRSRAFTEINTLSDRHKGLQDRVRDMLLNHRLLVNKVDNIPDKKIITICAESKGALQKNKVFSFGNGGKEEEVGYVMNFPGQILGIGVSSKRTKGDVNIIIMVNGKSQAGYDISLNNLLRKHNNFTTPLKVEAGDVINFSSVSSNGSCDNTIASIIIELFI